MVFKCVISRLAVFTVIVLASNQVLARGLDDFNLADEDQKAALKAEGVNADLIYLHKDWQKRDTAPVIQLSVLSGANKIDEYSDLVDALAGKSKAYQLILLDEVVRKSTKRSRVAAFQLLDDLNAFMFISSYIQPGGLDVWKQYQVWSWSSRRNAEAKCVIATDVEEKVGAYYEASIIQSVTELIVMCHQQFLNLAESDTAS